MRSEALVGASSPAAFAPQERGTGGKIRRPLPRKTPSTPYDRPLSQHRRSGATSAAGGGWMSKIVNPAYRLIAGGAARFLPSVFSSTHSLPAPPADSIEEGIEQETNSENQETNNENHEASIDFLSKSTAHEGPSEEEEGSDIFKSAEAGHGKSQHLAGDPDLSQIEQLIKGKTFCREDIDRLMGILQSRVVDAEGGALSLNFNTSENAAKVEISRGNPESEGEEKQENLEEDKLATLTPLLQLKANEEIGASPVEIAKAYMGSRVSEFDTGSKSLLPKNDRLFSHTNELPSNRFLSPPSPKPSICWPGAILQEQHGCLTPYSQRSSYGITKHSRTPYSRTIYSRSKSKVTPLGSDNRKLTDISETPFRKQTPLYGESSMRATEDVQGSVGPIRRLRNKFGSETPRRGSPSLWSSQKGSVQVKGSIFVDNPLVTKSIEPTVKSTSLHSTELKGQSEADTSVVHPHSRKIARHILEEVCRSPTQKEKLEELKLCLGKKNTLTSQVPGTSTNDVASTSYVGGFLPDNGRKNSTFRVPSANLPTWGINGTDSDGKTASKALQSNSLSFGYNRPLTTNQDSTQANEITNRNKPLAVPASLPSARTQVLNVPKPPTTSGTKPVLAPISVDKSKHRVRFADNSSSGFTFPTAAPSTASEPPTPSMMPVSSVTAVNPPTTDDTKPPTYSFGEKKSSATLVFSFPSTSNAPTLNDTPVFKFGSEGSSRVSFSSVGKDAVCY